jgi:hypothetical protein
MMIITGIAAVILQVLLGAWAVMIMAGNIHHDVHPPFPPWSLNQSIIVAVSLWVVGSFFRSFDSSSN